MDPLCDVINARAPKMALDWQCVERHRVRSDIAAKEVEAIGYSKPM